MAIFSVGKPIRLVVKGIATSVIPNAQGIPVAITTEGKVVDLVSGNNTITDLETIERIRRDAKFGLPDGIIEITEDDIEASKIREKKMKEADEEIKETRKKKVKV